MILALAGIGVYVNTINAPFHFDDITFLLSNRHITNLSFVFQDLKADGRKYLTFLTFALNYHFNGEHTFWYHVVNVFCHVWAGYLLFRVMVMLFDMPFLKRHSFYPMRHSFALCTALIFLVHPLQTQSVTYIWERSEVLSGLFYAAVLWNYLYGRIYQQRRFFLYAGLLWFAGLYAKGSVMTAPLLIVLAEIYFGGWAWKSRDGRRVIATAFGLAAGAFLIMLLSPRLFGYKFAFASKTYFLTQFPIIWKYLQLTFVPIGQSAEHSFQWEHAFFENVRVFFSGIALIVLFGMIAWLSRRWRLACFGALWYFVYLLPTSSIFKIGTPIFENRLYFSIPGFAILILCVIYGLIKHARARQIILVVFICILGVLAIKRNTVWFSQESLLLDAVKKNPGLPRPYFALGSLYLKQGHLDEAEPLLRQAIFFHPRYSEAYNNLGVIYQERGNTNEAMLYFQKAIELGPATTNAYLNSAMSLRRNGQYRRALKFLKIALAKDPGNVKVFLAYVSILLDLHRFDEASRLADVAIQVNPSSPIGYYLQGGIHLRQQQYQKAVSYYEAALQRDPHHVDALNELGVAYFHLNRWEDSRDAFEAALRLKPKWGGLYKNLANIYRKLGDVQKADEYYNKSLTFGKRLPSPH